MQSWKSYSDNKKPRYILLGKSLLTIYKVFLKLPIGYRDAIYDQISNSFFYKKLKSAQMQLMMTRLQYGKVWAISSVIPCTSHENLKDSLKVFVVV